MFLTKRLIWLNEILVLLCLITTALAQTKSATVFEKAMSRLAVQGHILIIAEGEPINGNAEIARVTTLLEENISLKEKVDHLAALYDYVVSPIPGGYAFSKRYSDPQELPCVTSGEVEATLKDCSRVISFDSPPPTVVRIKGEWLGPHTVQVRDFYLSLEPNQRQQVIEGVAFRSLTGEQQRLLTNTLKSYYYSDTLTQTTNTLDTFRYMATGRLMLKGSSGNETLGLMTWHLPTSTSRTGKIQPIFTSLGPDSLAKRFGHADELLDARYVKSSCGTIGDVVARLNKKGKGGSNLYRAADILLEKPLSVYGESFVSPETVMLGISRLYGLHLERDSTGSIRLNRFGPPLPVAAESFQAALQRIIPLPLQRCMRPADNQTLALTLNHRPSTVFVARAGQWLRTSLAETLLKKASQRTILQTDGIPFSGLSSRQQAAISIVLTGSFFNALCSRVATTPEYIRHMDSLKVQMKRTRGSDGKPVLTADFSTYNPQQNRWTSSLEAAVFPGNTLEN